MQPVQLGWRDLGRSNVFITFQNAHRMLDRKTCRHWQGRLLFACVCFVFVISMQWMKNFLKSHERFVSLSKLSDTFGCCAKSWRFRPYEWMIRLSCHKSKVATLVENFRETRGLKECPKWFCSSVCCLFHHLPLHKTVPLKVLVPFSTLKQFPSARIIPQISSDSVTLCRNWNISWLWSPLLYLLCLKIIAAMIFKSATCGT